MVHRTDLDQELVDQIKGLTLEYTDVPQPELLIPIPNRHPDVDYTVHVGSSEFTSLCPLHMAQPDFASIEIFYTPKQTLVELKSLKLYLVSFRQCPVFHEEIPAMILNSLVELLNPSYIVVTGDFTVRGGLHTVVTAHHIEEEEVDDA